MRHPETRSERFLLDTYAERRAVEAPASGWRHLATRGLALLRRE